MRFYHFFSNKVIKFLNEKIKSKDITAFIASHSWELLLNLTSKSVILEKNKIKFYGSTYQGVIKYLNQKTNNCKTFKLTSKKYEIKSNNVVVYLTYEIMKSYKKFLFFTYSIEDFSKGWKIILLPKRFKVSHIEGRYSLSLIIPKYFFRSKESILCFQFFHTKDNKKNSEAEQILFNCHWLNNNIFKLIINKKENFQLDLSIK